MGCIQSFFKKASLRSAHHSPEEQEKKFVDSNASVANAKTEKEKNEYVQHKTAPIVSEETSPADEDDDEAGSLGTSQSIPLIDGNAVKTLAASTGTVAILGTTAKCDEDTAVQTTASRKSEDDEIDRKPSKIPCVATYEKTSTVESGANYVPPSKSAESQRNVSENPESAVESKTIPVAVKESNGIIGGPQKQEIIEKDSRVRPKSSSAEDNNASVVKVSNSLTTTAIIENTSVSSDTARPSSGTISTAATDIGKIVSLADVKITEKPPSDSVVPTEKAVKKETEVVAKDEVKKADQIKEELAKVELKSDDIRAVAKDEVNAQPTDSNKAKKEELVIVSEVSKAANDRNVELPESGNTTAAAVIIVSSNTAVSVDAARDGKINASTEIRKEPAVVTISSTPIVTVSSSSSTVVSRDGSVTTTSSTRKEVVTTTTVLLADTLPSKVGESAVSDRADESASTVLIVNEIKKIANNTADQRSPPTVITENVEKIAGSDESPVASGTGSEKFAPPSISETKKESPKAELDVAVESDRTASDSEKDSTSNDIISVISEIKESASFRTGDELEGSAEKKARPEPVTTATTKPDENRKQQQLSAGGGSVSLEDKSVSSGVTKENESPSLVEEGAKEFSSKISNTSLNTLGEDDSQISDLEADIPKKVDRSNVLLRRFDTISSNGETSYNVSPVQEEGNLSSLSEELPEQLELLELENMAKEQYEMDENVAENRLKQQHLPEILESAKEEVDRICEQAIEKTNVYLSQKDTSQLLPQPSAELLRETGEEMNNVSECSGMSAVDSIIAEKGSDFDSLSFLDEQSDSRPLSSVSFGKEGTKFNYNQKLEYAQEFSTDQEDISYAALQDIQPPSLIQEDLSSADTEKTAVDSVSDDLPKPPELDELAPLAGSSFDQQLDIAEEEMQSVQLPTTVQEDEEALSTAAVKIQAGIRGYLTRKQIREQMAASEDTLPSAKNGYDDERNDRTFASSYGSKGKRMSLDSKLGDFENVRKVSKLRTTLSECKEDESEYAAGGKMKTTDRTLKNAADQEAEEAAKKIQSSFRNYRARKSIVSGNLNGAKAANDSSPDKVKANDASASDRIKANDSSVTSSNSSFDKIKANGGIPSATIKTTIENGTIPKVQLNTDSTKAVADHQQDGVGKANGTAIGDKPHIIVQGQSGKEPENPVTADKDKPGSTNDQPAADEVEAVRKIQAVFRGRKTRQSIQLTSSAATKIQAGFRGYKVRKEFKKANSVGDLYKNKNNQPEATSPISVEDKYAAKIQAGVRGYLVRKRHSLQNNAATKIQHNYRKYKSRKQSQHKQQFQKPKSEEACN